MEIDSIERDQYPSLYYTNHSAFSLYLLCYGGNKHWIGRVRRGRRPLIGPLTLPMLRLLSSKAQGHEDNWKPSKPCHVGIHLKALAEYVKHSIRRIEKYSFPNLTLNPYAAGGYFGRYKMMQKSCKMTETLENGYSSESTHQEFSNEYQHDRVSMIFKKDCILMLWTKVASAL